MFHLDPTPIPTIRPIGARSRARSAVVASGLASLLVLAACSGSGQAEGPTAATSTSKPPGTTTTESRRTTTTEGDDDVVDEEQCVPTEVVAEVVGQPVERQLSFGGSGGEVSYSYAGCSYDVADGDGSVGIGRVSGEELDGPELYDALEADAAASSDEDGFERVDDLGDEAYRDGRRLVVLHGPQVLLLAYTPTGDTDDRNPDDALRVAMAVLDLDASADPIDCDPIGDALVDEFGSVESTSGGGGFDSVNDATLEYQSCTITFDDGGEAEVGVADAGPFADWVAGKRDSIFNTTFEATSVGELRAFDNGDELFVDDGDRPLRVTTDELGLADEAAAELRISLAEAALGA
ncbi:MAG: hypothetical protein KF703_04525 [Actinobacteria bacterium]|nr:hypothetical protein [Actinomycetota bacterium]